MGKDACDWTSHTQKNQRTKVGKIPERPRIPESRPCLGEGSTFEADGERNITTEPSL